MSRDRRRVRTLLPSDLVPKQAVPDTPPHEIFFGLTQPEKQFVLNYVQSGDAHRAFVDAGLSHSGKYSRQRSWQYMQRPKIRGAIARTQAFFAEQVGLHAWQILAGLHGAAFHDPACLYEEDAEGGWQLRKMSEWPLASRLAVQKVKVVESPSEHGMKRQVEVEFSDRLHALALLGKHLKLFERKQELAPFTLVLNTASEPLGPKQVGETIEGIGLRINLPEPER